MMSIIDSPGKLFGQLRDDTFCILLRAATLQEILSYSEQDTQRECGGFLLGGVCELETPCIELRHFLPATRTRSQSGSLTFTHDTWATLNRELAERFPQESVLGWHHTHPNFGIFLSSYDQFIHRNFFRQPWQVALVVDPRRRQFGFFQWQGQQVVDNGFILVY